MGLHSPVEPGRQAVLELSAYPRNREHFARLLAFTGEIVSVCEALGIEPVASGSLVVLLYTKDESLDVNDIDLSTSEANFSRLLAAIEARGIPASITAWRVLQARRGDLKVEFDSSERWLYDLPQEDAIAQIGDLRLKVVGRESLVELYRRGLQATAGNDDATTAAKHQSIRDKFTRLTTTAAPPAAPRTS